MEIRTEKDYHKDKNFRWVYFGSKIVGQLFMDKKNFYIMILGQEIIHPKFEINSLQSKITDLYYRIIREHSSIIKESRFNSDGIDLSLHKKLTKPTGVKLK
jgi:hypothetical protein